MSRKPNEINETEWLRAKLDAALRVLGSRYLVRYRWTPERGYYYAQTFCGKPEMFCGKRLEDAVEVVALEQFGEDKERQAFRQKFDYCWICRRKAGWAKAGGELWFVELDIHEIARGVHRQKALKEPCAWIRVCRGCHEELGDYSKWPIARQLALKRRRDPENYDRKRVNELRGRAEGAVTEEEVNACQGSLA